MRQGQTIRGYRVITSPTSVDAGKSLWAFAERDGREYFLKEYLEPKRPQFRSMGDLQTKLVMLKCCQEFEVRQWVIADRIDMSHEDATHLVVTVDFFNDGTRFYKVTDRVRVAQVEVAHALTPPQKSVLLSTLAKSLRLLHGLEIVHGDLSPRNVLIHRLPGSDTYVTKLIDFDDAFNSGEPPLRGVIGGDLLYGAPEWIRWISGDHSVCPEDLTPSADMFAAGLLLHYYLVGSLPGHGLFRSPAEAVSEAFPLRFDPQLSVPMARLIRRLTSPDPADRPTANDVLTTVEDETNLAVTSSHHRGDRHPSSQRPSSGSRLRGTLVQVPDWDTAISSADGAEPPRLLTHLAGRTTGRQFAVDIVFCIDVTASMTPMLDRIKESALSLHSKINEVMHNKGRSVDQLRVKVVAFRDFADCAEDALQQTEFLRLPEQVTEFAGFVRSLVAAGGGDVPESGLEALALAVRSSWTDDHDRRRQVIVMFTDAPAHPLGSLDQVRAHTYPPHIPRSLDVLFKQWHDPAIMENSAKRLLLFAPEEFPWSEIGDDWNNTLFFPSKAGEGLEEFEMREIIDTLANSL